MEEAFQTLLVIMIHLRRTETPFPFSLRIAKKSSFPKLSVIPFDITEILLISNLF